MAYTYGLEQYLSYTEKIAINGYAFSDVYACLKYKKIKIIFVYTFFKFRQTLPYMLIKINVH